MYHTLYCVQYVCSVYVFLDDGLFSVTDAEITCGLCCGRVWEPESGADLACGGEGQEQCVDRHIWLL